MKWNFGQQESTEHIWKRWRRGRIIGRLAPACYLLHADFLLGLFFDSEDGSDMFLRNVG
jgi:hypothetical protein